jgi:hypothetical protein
VKGYFLNNIFLTSLYIQVYTKNRKEKIFMKSTVITLRVEESLKKAFKDQCEANGQNMSKVIELMIKKAIEKNNK